MDGEACICLYRPVVVVPAFAGGRKCGGACQPAGAGGSAPLFVPRGGNRLAAAGLGKNSPAGEKFSSKICRKIKFVVSLTNLKKKVAAGNYKYLKVIDMKTKKNFTAYAGRPMPLQRERHLHQSAGLLPQNFV